MTARTMFWLTVAALAGWALLLSLLLIPRLPEWLLLVVGIPLAFFSGGFSGRLFAIARRARR